MTYDDRGPARDDTAVLPPPTARAAEDVDGAVLPPPDAWTTRKIDPAVMDDAIAWLDDQLRQANAPETVVGVVEDSEPVCDGSAERDLRQLELRRPVSDLARRALPVALLLVLFDVAVALHDFLVARVFAVAFLLVVPGALILAASHVRPADGAVRLALVAATSTLYLTLVALVADLLFPLIGVIEPLERRPLLFLVNASLTFLVLTVATRRDPLVVLFGPRVPALRNVALAAALAALPMLSAAGAQSLTHGHGPTLAFVALAASGALLLGLFIGAERFPQWFVRAGLFVIAVAMVFSFTFSGDQLFGWDIHQEFQAFSTTMQSNTWYSVVGQDPYRAMLSITAFPVTLAELTGMSGVSLFRGVYPLLFASFPVLVYVVAGRWLPRRAAFAAAAFVVVQIAFSQQLPAIARQEIALVFFGVLVAVAFDDSLPVGYRRVVTLFAGSALAFMHYSTAYVTALAMLAAWALVRLVRTSGRRSLDGRVLTLPVVIGILGFTMLWNYGITRSTENVERFTKQVSEQGPEFLPSGEGRSVFSRWLIGNAPQRISGEEYARRLELIFEAGAPWLNSYPDDVLAEYPVVDARSPQVDGPLPQSRGLQATQLVVASQLLIGLTSLGVVAFAWRRRWELSTANELAMLGAVLLVFVAAMRVSGVAAEAYNQERAQIHAAAVLSIGLAAALAWLLARRRRLAIIGVSWGLTVIFLTSSGLAARIGGGAAPANLASWGDARERFAVTDEEVAAARWLAINRFPDSIVSTDRYGKLRIWASAVPIGGPSLQSTLIPATLDRNAYVLATEANMVGGRARGAIGPDYAVYEFPRAFLDANKAAIYSSGTTTVYR